ncbi:hypothetical protein MBRA1_003300 [Malassezia brasiliensis]|uniref:Bromo domain-containing protein n=1 Tax=Malassezia brasiliensis TaxID=1821822 RepID=A0AAF0DZ66_9BASI|nr:hypothetical protein MBRA1_003300 [Malassezia brasiliensis]
MTIAARPDEVRKSARRSTGTETPVPTVEQVTKMGQQMLDRVLRAKDREGDALAEPFMRLPSRRQYPEYYVVIKKPMTLTDIKTRLKQHEYTTFADVKHDFELICNNAKRFNMRDSEIWLQARDLHAVIKETSADVYDAWLAGETKAEKRSAPDDTADAKRRRLAESVAKSAVPKEERAESPKPHKITLRRSDTNKAKGETASTPKAKEIPTTSSPAAKAASSNKAASSGAAATPSKSVSSGAAAKAATTTPAETPSAATPAARPAPASTSTPPVVQPTPSSATTAPVARVVTAPYTSPIVPRPITTPYITEPRRRGAPRGKRLKVMLRWAVQSMTTLQDNEGHVHAEMFMELPSRQDYPDYYQFIQQPISFAEVDHKLDQKEYINPHALVTDLYRMLSNAQFYNEEHSQVWDDAQALRTHLDKVVIPAFLAEGFTLDPNDHRQAALPPGTPGAVPPPSPSPAPEASPARVVSPAAPVRPIVRAAPVGAASSPPPRSVPSPAAPVRPAAPSGVPSAPAPQPAPPAVPAMTLEQVVRAVEAKVWPAHPAALEAPSAALVPPGARTQLPCPIDGVRIQLYADAEAAEALAEVRLALTRDAKAQVIRVPPRTASAMVRLAVPERCALRVALDKREVGGAWLDAEGATYAFHVVLERGTHTLETTRVPHEGEEAGGRFCIYMNK